MNKKGFKRISDIVLKILSYICLVVLFLVACFLIFYIIINQIARNNNTNPIISIYTIVSESMIPNIKVYDAVVDVRVNDESELKVGDIITFNSDFIDTNGYTITHRIVGIDTSNGRTLYYTKGDHNAIQDEGYITFDNITGKVKFIIPNLGYLQAFVTSKLGWLIVIIIPAFIIILADVIRLFKVYRIKNQIEEMPRLKEVEMIREQEKNKKVRALLEKSRKINKDTYEKK
jgi:signal peptidase